MRRLALLLAAAAVGCGDADPSPDLARYADTVGVRVVENPRPLWGMNDAWTVSLRPGLEIGALEGSGAEQLQNVTAAMRQADGDLVVADGGAATVRLYGPDGSAKALLGGRGPAPGEFQAPAHMLLARDDTILIWDQASWWLSRFDAEGTFLGVETVRLEPIMQVTRAPLYPGSAAPLDAETLLLRLIEKGKTQPPDGLSRPTSGALLVTVEGDVLDTVALFPDTERFTLDSPWGPWPVEPPLARSTLTARGREGRVCYGNQATPEVRCRDADGATTAIRWDAPPPLVDDGAVDAWRMRSLEQLGQKLSPDDARRLLDRIPPPETAPAFSGIWVDVTGHLWVMRGITEVSPPGQREVLVFQPGGVLLGRVMVPAVRILDIGADYLLGVREDELGVQFLGLYSLDRH